MVAGLVLRPLFFWDYYEIYPLLTTLFMAGLCIGIGQWLILRRRFKRAWGWIPATAIVMPIGLASGVFGVLGLEYLYYPVVVGMGLWRIEGPLATGLNAGLLLGVSQWLSLRIGIRGMPKWILVSSASWIIAIGLLYIWGTYAPRIVDTIGGPVALGLLLGACVGAISGAFVKPCILDLAAPDLDARP
jgi:hypothetical protein